MSDLTAAVVPTNLLATQSQAHVLAEPKGGTATDTVVYGRDRYGAVIAPLPSPY